MSLLSSGSGFPSWVPSLAVVFDVPLAAKMCQVKSMMAFSTGYRTWWFTFWSQNFTLGLNYIPVFSFPLP